MLGTGGSQRLFAQSPVHGDLLDLLADVSDQAEPAETVTAVARPLESAEPGRRVAT